MTRALHIGGADVQGVFAAQRLHDEVVVLCTEEERRMNWNSRLLPGVRVIVTAPLSIRTDIQAYFRNSFDIVELETDDPPLRQKAREFLKAGGRIVMKGEARG